MASSTVTNSFRSTGGGVIECSFRRLLERSGKTGTGAKREDKKTRADTIHRAVNRQSRDRN